MKRLVWLPEARDDLLRILRFHSDRDPRVGEVLLERIQHAADKLTSVDTGRPGRMKNLREKSIAQTRYILAYRVKGQVVSILRVIHSAREWTTNQWPET